MQIIVFLLFIGAEKLVNRIAKRPVLNGAAWYLPVAAIMFGIELVRLNSAIPEGHASLQAQMLGRLVGTFLIPVCAAIYYARRFSSARAVAASETA
ncbi:hypothetical protein ACN28I_34165 [Archangium gephyra]|uniref:hypothetical protein n=1 Tax=Archangium gephyra TaxID=48 RepID=UPI003B79CB3E